MNLFNLKNQRITLSAPQDEEAADTVDVPAFTAEQWETLTAALELEDATGTDEVLAAVTELVESKTGDSESAEIAAAGADVAQPVIIDPVVWKDMQRSLKVGMTAEKQRHRLAAEQVVDQAIRLGKTGAGQRERWIAAYGQDPEATLHALNRGEEIPRMEIGYGIDPDASDGTNMPKGWVR